MLKQSLLFAICIMLCACGFHLRGHTYLPPTLKHVAVQSPTPYSLLSLQMQQTLKNMGVNTSQAAPLTLKLLADNFNQVSTSAGATNQLTTYTINYTVNYQIVDKKNKTLIAPRQVIINRNFTANNNQMLGSSNEQTLLQQDMRRDAIMQVISQLRSNIVLKAINQDEAQ